MGASRKLQIEIDRVLKKVQEGVDVFDSIWNKVYDTDNANQKEKFEADLKKEIKKLQRYRDQIKTWIQSSEIKDKKALMDARKLIEKEMERFKICEKETKTKAFSKEGLGQQPKTDPKEKAKSETRDWLNNTVSELESQIDSFEAEMEGLSVKKGKTRPPRLTHLESSITRHKAHIMKLELLLRLLDNDELSPEQVNDIKDFLDDYVERNQEDFDEFDDVDMLYSTLPLDKVESLEDLVTSGPPGLVKGAGATGAGLSIKSALSPSSAPSVATTTTSIQQGDTTQEQVNDAGPKNASILSASPTGTQAIPVGSSSVKGILDNSTSSVSPSSINIAAKGEEIGRKPSPALPESGLRNVGRTGVTNIPAISIPVTASGTVSSSGSLGVSLETPRRAMLGADERLGGSGIVSPLVSSLNSRMVLPPGGKAGDAVSGGDSGSNGEAAGVTSRVFSASGVSGLQWRPGSPFQSQHEGIHRRPEIVPDQRENYLQRLQHVQQGQGTLLGMPSLSGGNHKQFTTQQNPLLKQLNSQSSAASPQGAGLIVATSEQQKESSILIPTGSKDTDEPQQHQNQLDDSVTSNVLDKNTANEDVSKVSYTVDTQAGVPGSVTEADKVTRDVDLSPGQPLQPGQTASLGVIGRRSVSDLGAVGDNPSGLSSTVGPTHDQQYILQLLESSFYKLPQPKDSERAKTYIPRHPAVTPQSYPQVQAPIVSNPAFWERHGSDNTGTDTLFFAFYYQQNTYQQYLAAKELKKQSWRYHKKFNTWFQRHEEPKVATDDYELGTYVYFDFHMGNEEMQQGWCQRIKNEFKFEYSFLEDELLV
ncbi:putative CCR4-Not complex component, Not domain, CCR4-NOT complex subunit/5 domain superfamily [Helianthus annuus]|uniref:CCR4-NOT complex subunit 2/3/5 domain superfamily protein n=1 Tax=Helianthus annuus TaxID=4232 RepID=A0A251UBK6_HELAN|nr:general negative regulator of transcription subunit 3 isoform X4 [Helianthus annuus]KAF5772858.1 putative CCR4-NOT complex subunit 2/3/5 domain superfamily protein [Helianthus annuus]KAJ0476426.1 putative CCR4-Not complex component, Not domain, CCR4-NOT complex subunit/5 domain superfamily [Helianthus annuus]KAJ0497253.1 putative CCR4-Not complex component, Not domain, CCR4-NOT complex subunit/5 domain superfamily [Helianthus annuus]KAJ0670772.1 putative CCR4-Not complex component, Not domai